MKTDLKEEYLSVGQLAERIPYKPKNIRNLMCQGTFVEGIHFTRLTGRPIFLWTRVEQLLGDGAHERTRKGRAENAYAVPGSPYPGAAKEDLVAPSGYSPEPNDSPGQ